MGVKIITDSTCYIKRELLKAYDIKVISLSVIMEGKGYRELELNNIDFYNDMDKFKDIPTSSQPSMEESLEAFKEIARDGDDIVGIFLSSEMSGTYSTAHLIKESILNEYPNIKIELIDSRTNCMQLGFQVLQCARAAKYGKTIEEIIEICKNVRENSRFLFIPDTLKYLKKGGRIGGASALLGTILQIKPILTVNNGETAIFDKVRTMKKAINTIIDKVIADTEGKEIGEVIVHHINCPEKGLEVAKILQEKFKINVEIQAIGPVIGLHVGPGCIGVAYYIKS